MCGIYNWIQIHCVNTNRVPYNWYNQKANDKIYLELENIRYFHNLSFLSENQVFRISHNNSDTLNQKKNTLTSKSYISDFHASSYRILPQKIIFDSRSQANKSDHFSLYPFGGSTALTIKVNKVTVINFMCFIHLYYLFLYVQQCCQDPKMSLFYRTSLTRIKNG